MYKPNCGLKDVLMSYGHDEYLYQVLVRNRAQPSDPVTNEAQPSDPVQNEAHLPDEALYCIRYHSFYPWHSGGAYDHLCDDKDRGMLKWIREFK